MGQDAVPSAVLRELAPPLRLAVAYAPAAARPAWTALLALDQRLARAALGASEPLLGQLRLAWWRDRLREPAAAWPLGEPLLALLRGWDGERGALESLVDAWEGLIGGEPDAAAVAALAAARAEAVLALARLLGCAGPIDQVAAMARRWALADLAHRLGPAPAHRLDGTAARQAARLPRPLRPLPILAELAEHESGGLRLLARIVRLGLLGR